MAYAFASVRPSICRWEFQLQYQNSQVLPADPWALIPLPLVSYLSGVGKSAIYYAARAGRMPAPLRLSPRCSRWRAGDIAEYLRDPFNWAPSKAIDYRAPEVAA